MFISGTQSDIDSYLLHLLRVMAYILVSFSHRVNRDKHEAVQQHEGV